MVDVIANADITTGYTTTSWSSTTSNEIDTINKELLCNIIQCPHIPSHTYALVTLPESDHSWDYLTHQGQPSIVMWCQWHGQYATQHLALVWARKQKNFLYKSNQFLAIRTLQTSTCFACTVTCLNLSFTISRYHPNFKQWTHYGFLHSIITWTVSNAMLQNHTPVSKKRHS
eukprot:5157482-Ditylum_brightwellii.AAC.2